MILEESFGIKSKKKIILENFPEIRDWVNEICEKSFFDFRKTYEINLIINTSKFLGKRIFLREFERFNVLKRDKMIQMETTNAFSDAYEKSIGGYVEFDNSLNAHLIKIRDHYVSNEKRCLTIGHELGHILISHYNSINGLSGDSYTLYTSIVNKNIGKDHSKNWYKKWQEKLEKILPWDDSRVRGGVVEGLCEEISNYMIIDKKEDFEKLLKEKIIESHYSLFPVQLKLDFMKSSIF